MSTVTSITKSEPILLTGLARSAVLAVLGLTGWQVSDSTVVLAVTVLAAVLSFGVDFLQRASVFSPATVEALQGESASEAVLDVVSDLRAQVERLQALKAPAPAPAVVVTPAPAAVSTPMADQLAHFDDDFRPVLVSDQDDSDDDVQYTAPVV